MRMSQDAASSCWMQLTHISNDYNDVSGRFPASLKLSPSFLSEASVQTEDPLTCSLAAIKQF